MGKNHSVEARDSGGSGFNFNSFLVEFNVASNRNDANELIRAGLVELNGERIKDVLFRVEKGHYLVKLKGNLVAECTVL